MRRLRVDDTVIVLAGKDKDRTGDVVRFEGKDRVVVGGVNNVIRHTRAQKPGDRQGLVEKEAALHISNVAIYNPDTEKADKIGIREEDGEKRRFFRSTGEWVDQ